jgi:DNA-directed RNA polymerase subunit K/omega
MPVAPDYIRKVAKRALEIREELSPSRQAGTRVGLARANQLANGDNVSIQTLLRMRSYLLRAKQNYTEAKRQGKTAENSKAILAYMLWGGTRALPWVNRELKKVGR